MPNARRFDDNNWFLYVLSSVFEEKSQFGMKKYNILHEKYTKYENSIKFFHIKIFIWFNFGKIHK